VVKTDLLIVGTRLDGPDPVDVHIRAGRIRRIASGITPGPGEIVLEAGGGALLPGLHDHHLHLLALAAARESVRCGPPAVRDHSSLVSALRQAAAATRPDGWIRGVGYHESVAGPLDRSALDLVVADRAVRVQHRSGQLWVFNTLGANRAGIADASGHLFHGDAQLRAADGQSNLPDLTGVGALLASYGVTAVTDATVTNGPEEADYLPQSVPQHVSVMGDDRLADGPRKIVLHDDQFPSLDDLIEVISKAHGRGRVAAIHCVTRASLFYALTAFETAGSVPGDRIEHGSVIPDEAIPTLASLDLTVVTQPNFISERGDEYVSDVDADDQPLLYRLNGLIEGGVKVAGGTDAPFGNPDPWLAIGAAVTRRTSKGATLGQDERVSPEQAFALFTSRPQQDPRLARRLAPGDPANLCLLSCPWDEARAELSSELVRATVRGGEIIYQR
jgi:predicted amidohydrolase YtcJ